jgi:RNA polymerase subunit RPABC4/transcription elongation factor Spt4
VSTDNAHLADRAARAEKIIAAPDNFKVCEGCDSIVTARVVSCPNCHGYRFDESPERVVEQARLLATRPQQSVTAQDLS